MLEIYFILSQLLVLCAIVTDYISFQYKERKKILLILSISSLLIAIHYLLLNQVNAFIFEILILCAFLVSAYTTSRQVLALFLLVFLFPLIFNYSGYQDILIFIGVYISLIAKFQKNDKLIRILTMLGTLFIVVYNIIIFTPMGVLLELMYLMSNISGYYKFYIKKFDKKSNIK